MALTSAITGISSLNITWWSIASPLSLLATEFIEQFSVVAYFFVYKPKQKEYLFGHNTSEICAAAAVFTFYSVFFFVSVR